MNYKDIDYTKYLRIDNGKGILLSNYDIEVLKRYGFDYTKYTLKDLIALLDIYLNDDYQKDLEEISLRLNEMYYYNNVNK